jgi:hypothetical protein
VGVSGRRAKFYMSEKKMTCRNRHI